MFSGRRAAPRTRLGHGEIEKEVYSRTTVRGKVTRTRNGASTLCEPIAPAAIYYNAAHPGRRGGHTHLFERLP
ncbi:hypothetical protein CUPL110328_10850 [Cupriavidus plantarum]|nr:hypothetical protein LMG26296_00766 [Cupriavidus plantarum]SMR67098.1 hypothetical protein SAMN05421735_1993 [Cupriavidus plantarum]